ncbi:MAG: hypothetical protein ACK4E2_02650 [Pseudothermotoga sp.]
MKKYVLVSLLLLVLQVFSLDMHRSLKIYTQLIDSYNQRDFSHPFLASVERELNSLSLYRYYKLLIAGSTDKREATPDVGDYLGAIYDVVQAHDEDEQLAYSLFLSYLVARMNGTNLTTDIVMKNNSFVKFFSNYRDLLGKEARTFFAWVISYQVGLCEEKPPVEIEKRAQLEADYVFQPPTNLQHLKDLALFYSDPSVQQTLKEAVQRAVDNITKDPSRAPAHINREAAFVARDISRPVTTFQAQIAEKAVIVTPKNINLWWLRFAIYIIAIVLALRYGKVLKIVISVLACFEVVYLIYFFDFLSPIESLVYGLFAVLGFLFAIFSLIRRSIKKRVVLELAVLFVIVIIFLVPFVFNCDALSMNSFDQLRESVYYSMLKRDLFQDELSKLSYYARSMSSTLYVSMDETKKLITEFVDVLGKVHEKKAIEEITIVPGYIGFSSSFDFFNADNFDQRMALFSGPSRDLQSYLLDEKSRKSSFESAYRKFSSYVKKIMTYSTWYLREDFSSYLRDLFTAKYPILSSLLRKIPFDSYINMEMAKPNVPVSKEKTSVSIMLGVMFVFMCMIFLDSKISMLPSIVLAGSAVFKWLSMRDLVVFVEQGIPALKVSVSGSVNPGIFIIAVVLSLFNLYKLLRKGEKVA